MSEVGARFGRIVVTKIIRKRGSKTRAVVRCDCGQTKEVIASNLTSGHTRSCGCLHSEKVREATTKHGARSGDQKTAEYEAWCSMISRCYDPKCHSYRYFGAVGVSVCREWRDDYSNFLTDVGSRPSPDHQLSRRRKDRNYTPANTYWATRHEADRNRSNNRFFEINGERLCLEDWAERYDIPKSTLHYRLSKGLTMREALDLGRGRQGKVLHA